MEIYTKMSLDRTVLKIWNSVSAIDIETNVHLL